MSPNATQKEGTKLYVPLRANSSIPVVASRPGKLFFTLKGFKVLSKDRRGARSDRFVGSEGHSELQMCCLCCRLSTDPVQNLTMACSNTLWKELQVTLLHRRLLERPHAELIKDQLGSTGCRQVGALWNCRLFANRVCSLQIEPVEGVSKGIMNIIILKVPISLPLLLHVITPPTSYHKDPENLAMKTHTFVKPAQPQFVAASFFVNLFHCDSVIFLPWKASPHGGFSMGNVESRRKGF